MRRPVGRRSAPPCREPRRPHPALHRIDHLVRNRAPEAPEPRGRYRIRVGDGARRLPPADGDGLRCVVAQFRIADPHLHRLPAVVDRVVEDADEIGPLGDPGRLPQRRLRTPQVVDPLARGAGAEGLEVVADILVQRPRERDGEVQPAASLAPARVLDPHVHVRQRGLAARGRVDGSRRLPRGDRQRAELGPPGRDHPCIGDLDVHRFAGVVGVILHQRDGTRLHRLPGREDDPVVRLVIVGVRDGRAARDGPEVHRDGRAHRLRQADVEGEVGGVLGAAGVGDREAGQAAEVRRLRVGAQGQLRRAVEPASGAAAQGALLAAGPVAAQGDRDGLRLVARRHRHAPVVAVEIAPQALPVDALRPVHVPVGNAEGMIAHLPVRNAHAFGQPEVEPVSQGTIDEQGFGGVQRWDDGGRVGGHGTGLVACEGLLVAVAVGEGDLDLECLADVAHHGDVGPRRRPADPGFGRPIHLHPLEGIARGESGRGQVVVVGHGARSRGQGLAYPRGAVDPRLARGGGVGGAVDRPLYSQLDALTRVVAPSSAAIASVTVLD